jgi:threonine dehydrogenase-like Zn-dependent dehydrogenase
MAIALLERKEIDAADFVTHSYPLKEVSQALQTAEHDKAQAIKVIVTLEQAT